MTRPESFPLEARESARVLAGLLAEGRRVRFPAGGGSMSPWIRDGDDLTVAPFGDRGPRPGDVVAYRTGPEGRLVVHRIVSRARGGWITRGDRLAVDDGPVATSDLLGRLVRVERKGRARPLPRGRAGLLLAGLVRPLLAARSAWRAGSRCATAPPEA